MFNNTCDIEFKKIEVLSFLLDKIDYSFTMGNLEETICIDGHIFFSVSSITKFFDRFYDTHIKRKYKE